MEEINIVTEEAIETPAEGTTVPVSEPVTQESADTDRAEVSVLLPPACKTVEVLSTGMDTGCLFQQCCAAIDTCVQNIEQNYLQIARNLHFLQKTKLYRQEGCSNIYELALKRWNLSKTTCSNLLGICRRFCKQNPDTGMYEGLLPEYEDFSISALREMLPMADEQIQELTPDMTVQEIRRRKKSHSAHRQSLDTHADSTASTPEKPESPTETDEKPASPAKADKKPVKAGKQGKVKLLKAACWEDLNGGLSSLQAKIQTFEEGHPEAKYQLEVQLTYSEEE